MRCIVVLCLVWLSIFATGHRIVAVGDIHGDADQLRAVLRMSDIIDAKDHWIGGDATLVQMGDMLDRGPQDKDVMDLLMGLQDESEVDGGRVVVLLGNHELMNLQGHFHYVHPDSDAAFGGRGARTALFSKKGKYGAFLRRCPVVAAVGDTIFVHAGIPPEYAAEGVDGLNARARRALAGDLSAVDAPTSVFSIHGPVWTRRQIHDATKEHCASVRDALRRLNASRIVVGHTPQRDGHIGTFCGGAMLAVDVGLSKWMYGHLAALEITSMSNRDDEKEYGETVELREIVPSTDEHSAVRKDDESSDSSLEGNLRSDEHLLREIQSVLNEAQQEQASTSGIRRRRRRSKPQVDHLEL